MNRKSLLLCISAVWIFAACEVPKAPDFKTAQKIDIPVFSGKEFVLLGEGEDVLIDTTKTEFDSLFTVDPGNSLISISRTENFDFGDLDDAIPVVNVDPTSFNAEVGELSLGDFSSQGAGGNLGQADFQSLTGLNPAFVPSGTAIPGGGSPAAVNIPIDTDYFVSATLKDGQLSLTITNELGFNIDQINLTLNSGTTPLGPINFTNVNHNTTANQTITFSNGDVLQNLNVDMTVNWSAQTTQATPGAITVNEVTGQNLTASEIVAAVEPQDFSTNGTTDFADDEFRFEDPSHFVELAEGTLVVDNIINQIDIGIDTLVISFPGILLAPDYNNNLEIRFEGPTAISGNSGGGTVQFDLAGARITAPGNLISYDIIAKTEDTQTGGGAVPRSIRENDQINADVRIDNIVLNRVRGVVIAQEVLLNDDEFGDSILDLANGNEAELTEIDGLDDLSEQLDGIEFSNPELTVFYETNIGIETNIIGAFLGINGNGEEVFLTGTPGTSLEVLPTDDISGLQYNGVPLAANQLLKFGIDTSQALSPQTFSITFDGNNTNAAEFLNNLPSEIRFIGKAAINPDELEGAIGNPVVFDPEISIDLPIAIETPTAATFNETEETTDFEDLPAPGDDVQIGGAQLYLNYDNGFPFGVELTIVFLNESGGEITRTPQTSEPAISLIAAGIDPITRFVNANSAGDLVINLSKEQFENLSLTRTVEIEARLLTTNSEEVRLRASDRIVLGARATIEIEATVK